MKSLVGPSIVVFLSLCSCLLFAQSKEEARLRGFTKHQEENERFDAARRQGERAYLEQVEKWEAKKVRSLTEHKKNKKDRVMTEDSPEALVDAKTKQAIADKYEKNRQDYLAGKTRGGDVDRSKEGLPTESEELGIVVSRPRYDFRKRAMFGAKPKYGKAPSITPGSSSSSSSGSALTLPPPPRFDDFDDGDGGPAGGMVDDFAGDIPPPPPPPAFGDDFGGDLGGGMDDFPPPPPPPPSFDDGGEF